VFLSGTFTRSGDDQLLARYGSPHEYLARVKRAADHLAAAGYITHDDRKALVTGAEVGFANGFARRR
jgi:hypothetical protein